MEIRRFTPKQSLHWVGSGLRFLKRSPAPWILTGLFLSLVSLGLLAIPFVGPFLLAFLLPVIYASMLRRLNAQLNPAVAPGQKTPPVLFPLVAGFGAMTSEQGVLIILIPGTFALVSTILVLMLFGFIGGPFTSIVTDISGIGTINLLRLFAAYAVAYLFCLVLMAYNFYAVPLFLREDLSLADALKTGLRATGRNLLPIMLLLALLLLPFFVSAMLMQLMPLAGIGLWIVAGSLLFPLLAHSAWCGNRLTMIKPAA